MKSMGLYIHIPFCEKKCHYCDFTSVPGNSQMMDKYVQYLKKELVLLANRHSHVKIDTIFIGGGTPSVLQEKHIASIMEEVDRGFLIDSNAEITIEVNPGTITEIKAKTYRDSGINRISMGIQSMNDNLLRLIGRIHDSNQVISTVEILRKAGFNNINGDIIFGLPHQTIRDFQDTLKGVIELGLEHISMYGLILEENTLLHHWYRRGLVTLPGEDEERSMYHVGRQLLRMNGYDQYEISNFSMDGMQCIHNIGYWKLKPYLGAGLSSHSLVGDTRYWNTSEFRTYFALIHEGRLPVGGKENISPDTKEAEYLILGIRLMEGISINDYENRFSGSFMGKYENVVNKHIEAGLLKLENGFLRLTDRGMDLSNLVEVDFIP